jgi:eukaryotic-like serine/threonine-protein kinase
MATDEALQSTIGTAVANDSAAENLPPGACIGRYSIRRLLGEGGMGAVYEAVHVDLKKRVAVKTLHRRIASSPDARTRFLREGQAASRIRHEHVVDVYDVGVERDVPYLVMEYLEGENLAEHLAREGKLSVEQAADVMIPVLAALALAHDLSVIHRDLKPENVFLCRSSGRPRPKVLDFGISKVVDEAAGHALTGTAALLGTPYYMSPEQAQNAKQIDARSDQYSLGVILYECVTGRRPFAEETLYKLLQKIVAGEVERPRSVNPELAEDFEALILRAMSRDAADRFESVRAMARELLPFASQATRVLFGDALAGDADSLDAAPPERRSSPRAAETPHPAQASHAGASSTLQTGPLPVRRFPKGALTAVGGALALVALIGWWSLSARAPADPPVIATGSESAEPAALPSATAAPTPQEQTTIAPAEVIKKEIRSEPPGAAVYVDGKRVGATPHLVELSPSGDPVTIELRAPQHLSQTKTVTPSDPPEITISLKPQAAARPAGPARPSPPSAPELAPR